MIIIYQQRCYLRRLRRGKTVRNSHRIGIKREEIALKKSPYNKPSTRLRYEGCKDSWDPVLPGCKEGGILNTNPALKTLGKNLPKRI